MRGALVRSKPARGLFVAIVCACLPLAGLPCRADEEQTLLKDEWYALYLNDRKAGYTHEQVAEKRAGEVVTYESKLHQEFALARGNVSVRFVTDTTVSEDAEGRLIAFRQQIQGPMSLTLDGKVEGEELVITSSAGQASETRRVPVHDGLCPWALHRLRQRMGYEPGTKYTASAFIPDMPARPVEVSLEVVGKEEAQVFEITKHLQRTDTTISSLPGITSSDWVDDSGTVWLVRARLPGNFTLEGRRATKELALAPDDPSDVLAASVMPTDKPISEPRSLEHLEIVLQLLDESADEPAVPSGSHQHVERVEEGLRITIKRAHPSPDSSYTLPYTGAEHTEMVRANVWMETEAPVVVEMTLEAVGEEDDALAAAKRIEGYVREIISEKSLSVGFATAAETAVQKAGDCTEHAVLVAALARAAGMPSRVVGGLVYAENLPAVPEGGFGYHMWTEVYVGEWLPLDAALGGHDATHLALVRSDLNSPGDLLAISSAISRLFGCARVQVLAAEH